MIRTRKNMDAKFMGKIRVMLTDILRALVFFFMSRLCNITGIIFKKNI